MLQQDPLLAGRLFRMLATTLSDRIAEVRITPHALLLFFGWKRATLHSSFKRAAAVFSFSGPPPTFLLGSHARLLFGARPGRLFYVLSTPQPSLPISAFLPSLRPHPFSPPAGLCQDAFRGGGQKRQEERRHQGAGRDGGHRPDHHQVQAALWAARGRAAPTAHHVRMGRGPGLGRGMGGRRLRLRTT
eukprot:scaffold23956_cov67-Isochrysis_galbana.AAC.2